MPVSGYTAFSGHLVAMLLWGYERQMVTMDKVKEDLDISATYILYMVLGKLFPSYKSTMACELQDSSQPVYQLNNSQHAYTYLPTFSHPFTYFSDKT